MSPPEAGPPPPRRFRITLDATGGISLDCPSTEVEEAVRRGFQLRVTKDLDGQIVRLDLGVDLHPLRMLKSLEEVV